MSVAVKNSVLSTISGGTAVVSAGQSKHRIGKSIVHVRFCSASAHAPGKFKFNINPNTLSADFELWVCGESSTFYLMPISFIRTIYDNPNAYQDKHHVGIKVVSVDSHEHKVMFAAGGVSASLKQFFGACLNAS